MYVIHWGSLKVVTAVCMIHKNCGMTCLPNMDILSPGTWFKYCYKYSNKIYLWPDKK